MTSAHTPVGPLFFEDYQPGMRFAHARGKTITEMDNVMFTHLTMNTAQAHFNEHAMAQTSFGKRITFGGITASMVIGLASADTGENVLAELGIDALRLQSPVFHGDTLYAFSEVIETKPAADPGEGGVVSFRHWGMNQRDQIVCQLTRTVLMQRRRKESHV